MFILTDQLNDDTAGLGAFRRYQAYLESVQEWMPEGAYALARSGWYFDSSDHRAPHDARLEGAAVREEPTESDDGRREVTIIVRLLSAYEDGHIELRYRNVSRYRLELGASARNNERGHQDWRYDEFRLAPYGRVEHEIEWWGRSATGAWIIEAEDVEYTWIPLSADAAEYRLAGDGGRALSDAGRLARAPAPEA